MAKYARGKKSKAISDRSGLRIKYTELKTTWDGLRVSPEDWEPKHPQLTPAKNVIDATVYRHHLGWAAQARLVLRHLKLKLAL